jgi:hypothetical protein
MWRDRTSSKFLPRRPLSKQTNKPSLSWSPVKRATFRPYRRRRVSWTNLLPKSNQAASQKDCVLRV